MTPPQPPKYVYKIVPEAPPSPIPEEYPLSDLDKQDGFIHLSTGWQVPITAGLFFKDATSLWILKIRFAFSPEKVSYENGDGCPHLHGNFGAADVEGFKELRRVGNETWEEAMKKESEWLV